MLIIFKIDYNYIKFLLWFNYKYIYLFYCINTYLYLYYKFY